MWYQPIPSGAEQLSEEPTVTPATIPSSPPITPGGLAVADNTPTLGKLQAGSCVVKLVVAIEGCEVLLSDAPSASVLAAWAGDDWTEVLGGLFVELQNSQSISPDEPFPKSGRCRISILDTDHSDRFGKHVHRRAGGAETTITSTVDRNDTSIPVADTSAFPSSGTIYIGTEAIGYASKTATSFDDCTRGKWSPLGCHPSGAGGIRFANHHTVANDANLAQKRPAVTEQPRVWLGKRVSVYLHTYNAEAEALNTKESAQRIFAGRIVNISDDPATLCTSLEIEHESNAFRNAIIGHDMLKATVADGLSLIEGRVFKMRDWKAGSAAKEADVLTVVSGAPASVNEIQAGYYRVDELGAALAAWIASERSSNRLYGFYNLLAPTNTNVGVRTVMRWKIEDASDIDCRWTFELPGEVAVFLGITDADPGSTGQSFGWYSGTKDTNVDHTTAGTSVPFANLIFKPLSPGRISQEIAESLNYELEDEQGTFYDQYALLPASMRESCDSTKEWGCFLLDEKKLMVGNYEDGVLKNCWLAPFPGAVETDPAALGYIGRRLDEPDAGPVSIRQVLAFEDTFKNIFLTLAYSSGTNGHNHADYDTLGYGLGLNMPGEVLHAEFERSLATMPGADQPMLVMIDEPTKFAELFRDDLQLRRAFVRWIDEGFEFCRWRTPLVANANVTLSESNKAAPSGDVDNQRIAAEESDEWLWPVVKLDYAKDFAIGRNGQYLKSLKLVDSGGVDDSGNAGKSITLKLRNCYHDFANQGAAVEALVADYVAGMPMFSRPARKIVRTIDSRFFEGVSVGDIAIVTDEFARDPLTGARGINARAAFITRHTYNLGGPTPNNTVRPMTGEVELFFLDTQRGAKYAPSADVDYEASLGGFVAGYRDADATLRCRNHVFSYVLSVDTRRGPVSIGEALDAQHFVPGDKITIVEIDPADPAAPVTWDRTVDSVNVNDIVLTSGLSSPAFDSSKRYRISYDRYSDCQASQQDFAFQADDADELVQDDEIPYHFSSEQERYTFVSNTLTANQAELVPTQTYGDGRPVDVGTDYALANTVNMYTDYKSAHEGPFLWSNIASAALGGFGTETWNVLYAGPVFFGLEHLSTTIGRSWTVAPFWRSQNGTDSWLRITLSRIKPQVGVGINEDDFGAGGQYYNSLFTAEFSQSAEYFTDSTTWQADDDATLSVGVKDIHFGWAWLVVEGAGAAQCRGLHKCHEGPRVVNP